MFHPMEILVVFEHIKVLLGFCLCVKNEGDLLLEIVHNHIMLAFRVKLELQVRATDYHIDKINQKSFSLGGYPEESGEVLIQKYNSGLDIALAVNLHGYSEYELLFELVVSILVVGLEEVDDKIVVEFGRIDA